MRQNTLSSYKSSTGYLSPLHSINMNFWCVMQYRLAYQTHFISFLLQFGQLAAYYSRLPAVRPWRRSVSQRSCYSFLRIHRCVQRWKTIKNLHVLIKVIAKLKAQSSCSIAAIVVDKLLRLLYFIDSRTKMKHLVLLFIAVLLHLPGENINVTIRYS